MGPGFRIILVSAICKSFVQAQSLLPGCWSGCVTTAAEAYPSCLYAYGLGASLTSCYCGHDQSLYKSQAECCAVSRCAATDFSIGHTLGVSACANFDGIVSTDGSIVCPATTIYYTGISHAGAITTADSPTPTGAAPTASSPSSPAFGGLTASCGSPTFTSIIAEATTTSFPLIGCAPNNPSCCPNGYNPNIGGLLSACPSGYSAISNTACCPSGWSLYTTALGNNIPCVTTPAYDLPAPNASTTDSSVTAITNRLFALQLPLSTATSPASQPQHGLSTGAKAGIGAGAGVIVLAVIAGVGLFLMKRNKRTPPAQELTGDMQYTGPMGPGELHGDPAKNQVEDTAKPVQYGFKPGFAEVDSTPVQNGPYHGYVEVDGTGREAHYELEGRN